MLAEIAERFGSPPVRNAGTLGGNIANGSPIGDSMPFLIALGATVRLRRGERRRELPLESFYLGYQKKALEPGEFLEAVRVPLPRPGRLFASYKVSKRFDQDISAVCGAFAVDVEDGRVAAARIAFGGMAAIPPACATHRSGAAGQAVDAPKQSVLAALPALARDYTPITRHACERAAIACRWRAIFCERFFLEHDARHGCARASSSRSREPVTVTEPTFTIAGEPVAARERAPARERRGGIRRRHSAAGQCAARGARASARSRTDASARWI